MMRIQNRRRIHITKEQLRYWYIGLEQTTTEIGNRIGCSAPIVKARLKEYKIPVRTLKESMNTAPHVSRLQKRMTGHTYNIGRYKFVIGEKELYSRYIELQQSAPDIAKDIGCSKCTILQRLAKYQIPFRSGKEAHNIRNYLTKFEIEIPEAELRVKYIDEQFGARRIANLYNCSYGCVRNNLRRYGIPIRTRKQAQATPTCVAGREKTAAWGRTVEARELRRRLMNGRYKDPAERERTGTVMRKYHEENPEFSKQQTEILLACRDNPEVMKRWLESMRRVYDSPNWRKKRGDTLKGLWANPKMRRRWIKRQRDLWASNSPKFIELRRKMIAGLNLRPNKPETVVLNLLSELFPSEWKYVGDGQVIIGGLNPDIINTNGRKLIIEVFGDYWHTQQLKPYRINEGRREVYAEYGYKTLIVWEHETKKDLDKLKKRIAQFATI